MPSCARLIRSVCLCLALAFAPALAGPPAAAQTGDKPAIAIGADLASQGGTTRLTLTLSRAVEARGFVMERPDRAVIDLPEVNFQLESGTGSRRDGLVQSFRYGLFAPGRSRIVIDLANPATVGKIETTTRAKDGAVLLTIPLQRTDREAFRRAAAAADPAPAQARAAAPSRPTSAR